MSKQVLILGLEMRVLLWVIELGCSLLSEYVVIRCCEIIPVQYYGTRVCLTFVKMAAIRIAYRRKNFRSLKILMLCNSSCFYKLQAITSIPASDINHCGLSLAITNPSFFSSGFSGF